MPPWHVLAGAVLLIISLFHYLSEPTGAAWLENFKYIALGAVALCLPLIALRALLALRRGVRRCAVLLHAVLCLPLIALRALLALRRGVRCCAVRAVPCCAVLWRAMPCFAGRFTSGSAACAEWLQCMPVGHGLPAGPACPGPANQSLTLQTPVPTNTWTSTCWSLSLCLADPAPRIKPNHNCCTSLPFLVFGHPPAGHSGHSGSHCPGGLRRGRRRRGAVCGG